MQPKTPIGGLLAAVACLWLLLTWEPVSLDEHESSPSSAEDAAPEVAPAAPPAAAQPAALPAAEAPSAEPAAAPAVPALAEAPAEETAHQEPQGQMPSGMNLQRADPRVLDTADIPPPSASGPLAALQTQFEGGARDASSVQMEQTVQDAFKLNGVAPELLESAVCQGEVCRVRSRWTPERAGGFTVAMTSLALKAGDVSSPAFEKNFAVGEASERNSNGERIVDVYLHKSAAK